MDSASKITLPSINVLFEASEANLILRDVIKSNDLTLPSLVSLNLPYPKTRNGSLPLIQTAKNYQPYRTASVDGSISKTWEYSSSQKSSSPEERVKRHRRSPDEVVRFYKCLHGNCDKSYGTLNHLNFHIQTQNHGQKQLPAQYRELRLALRRQRRLQKASFSSKSNHFLNNQLNK